MAQTYLGDDSVAKELENEEKVRLALEKEGFSGEHEEAKARRNVLLHHLPPTRRSGGSYSRVCAAFAKPR